LIFATVALHSQIKSALEAYSYAAGPGAFIILNSRTGKAISRVQAYRIIRAAGEALGFKVRVSCHSGCMGEQ
jgi:hypothetical protein